MKRSLVVFLFLASSFVSARDFPIRVTSPRGGEFYLPGQRQAVVLDSGTRAKLVLVELSSDGGNSFEFLGTVDNTVRDRSKRNILVWVVPFTETRNAVIRVTSSDSRRPGAGLSNSFGIGQPALESSIQSFGYVIRSGDDMSGPLTLSRDPKSDSEASNKRYVDVKHKDLSEKKVSKSGGVMTGDLVLSGTPYSPFQAATKEYVDSTASDSDTVDGKHADDFLDKAGYASSEKGKVLLAEVADLATSASFADFATNSSMLDDKGADDFLDKESYASVEHGKVLKAEVADFATSSSMLDNKGAEDFLDKESYASVEHGKVLKAEVADMLDDKRASDFLDKATYDHNNDGVVYKAERANLLNGRPDTDFLRTWTDNTTSGSIVVTGLGRKMSVLSSTGDDAYGSVPKLEVKTPDGNDGFSVNQHGLVKSSSGYEFPDGTVQTTAAPTSSLIPSGYTIFGSTTTPPEGFSYLGTSVGPVCEKWEKEPILPTQRYDLCSAVVDGIIYVMGGQGGGSHTDDCFVTNEAYNPSNKTWTPKASLPYMTYQSAAVSLGGFVYVVGGRDASATTSIIRYDPVADQWTEAGDLAKMNTSRWNLVAEAVDGKIYAMGGENNGGSLNSVEEYDPVDNSWSTMEEPMAVQTYDACSAVVNGKIYVIGGYQGLGVDYVQEYDPSGSGSCVLKSEIPHARYQAVGALLNGRIYVISGLRRVSASHPSSHTCETYEYDPVSDTWVSEQPEYDRQGGTWSLDCVRKTWKDYPSLQGPNLLYHATCSVVDGKIHVIGGRTDDSDDTFDSHFVYSVSLLFAHKKD